MKPRSKKTILAVSVALAGSSAALAADQKTAPPAEAKESTRPSTRAETSRAAATDALVRDFDQARQEYLARRGKAKAAAPAASAMERQILRERLKTQHEEQARTREELREQLRAMRERLPSHQDLIEDARERAGSRPRRGD